MSELPPFSAGIPAIEPYDLPGEAELPANAADWTVDPDRAVLLLHDMQRYFLRPLPDATRATLVGNAVRLRDRCAGLGIPVGYTAQPGSMSEDERGLLADFWGPGMRRDEADRRVIDELAPTDEDWQFTKWRYSAFFRSDLLPRMRAQGRDQLVIAGVYAHVGVLMTAVEAFTNDIQPFLVADATADFSRDFHHMALHYAAGRCAVVAGTGTLLGQLTSRTGARV